MDLLPTICALADAKTPENKIPGEKFNIAADHAKILDEIETIRKKHLKNLVPEENQLIKRSFPG
jgi:hypothetical protein